MRDIPFKRRKRAVRVLVIGGLSLLLALAAWGLWGGWPDPDPAIGVPWTPDAIVVLGGGGAARGREAMRWHERFPSVPVIVTGDGGVLMRELLDAGLPAPLLRHEDAATTTEENARFTDPLLKELGATRVVLVSSWFHIPRSLAVFRNRQSQRRFIGTFEEPESRLSKWDQASQRRERLAAVWYLLRYGINSFSSESPRP